MADTKNIQVNIKGSATSLQQASKKAKSSLGGIQKAAASAGTAIVGALGAAVVIQGIGRTIAKIAEFESTMRRVAIISKGSEKELSNLAKTLGKTTVFTANAAGSAMTFLAQAGFNANQILEATPGVLELAAAAQLDLARAADIASNVLSAYGLEASEINRINDILVTTTNNANTNVEQFAEAFKVVGPIAKGAGISINELSALIGVLGDAGIQGSLAGTQLKVAISTLINPSEKAKKVLKDLGIETKNTDGSMRNLTDIFADLRDAGLTAEQAFQIFEQRAASGALVMSGAADKARELAEQTKEVGVAAEQSSRQLDTLSGDIKLLDSAWEGALLEGSAFNGILRNMTQTATLIIGALSELANAGFNVVVFFDNLSQTAAEANLAAMGLNTTYQDFKDILFGVNDGLDATIPFLTNMTAVIAPLTVEQVKLNAELAAYSQFIADANAADNARTAIFVGQVSQMGMLNTNFTALTLSMKSFASWQEINKKRTEELTSALRKQNAITAEGKRSSQEAAAAQAGLALANGQSAKAIIAQSLAVGIANALAKVIGGLPFPLNLIVAAGIPALVTGLFNAVPEFARGTSFAPGGAALVGERGPEVVSLPRGARVTPNNMIGGGGGVSIVVNGFVGDEYQLATIVQEAIANQGSNVDRTSFV